MLTKKEAAKQAVIDAGGSEVVINGTQIEYVCRNGHRRSQYYCDILSGCGCAKCKRMGRAPRAPKSVSAGTRIGDLEVVKELGVVNGHSMVIVRNVTNGLLKDMTVHDFKRQKHKLLSESQLRDVLVANGKRAKGRRNPKNSSYTVGDFDEMCSDSGMVLMVPYSNRELPMHHSAASGEWSVRCKCGKMFFPRGNNILSEITRSCGCVKSFAQKEVYDFVLGVAPDALLNDRNAIAPMELDIFVPSKQVAVEYCGLYWHGEKLNGPEARTKHLDKLERCREKGIRLITIFEDEWLSSKNAVCGFIRAILGFSKNAVGARKLIVREVPKEEARAFLTNHLQGNANGISLGLYSASNVLLALAVFARPNASRGRKSEPGVWELARYCVHPDWRVQGGLGKLIAAFKARFQVSKLVSYSDNRWSEGGVYKATGFEKKSENPPSYWYFQDHKQGPRKHRYTYRKSEAVRIFSESPDKTEWEINSSHGLDRIWDCGSIRWELDFDKA